MLYKKIVFFIIIYSFLFQSCQVIEPDTIHPVLQNIEVNTPTPAPKGIESVSLPKNTSIPPTPSPSPVPTEVIPQQIGPDPEDIPEGYNPLTGLPVENPENLKLPAILVSITNFPPSSRPQAGLSFSPWVYEVYISEGMTRFLAAFYGDFPKLPASNTANIIATQPAVGKNKKNLSISSAAMIGPVRSGRLAYVYVRDFFQSSCLVYASATVEIRARLRGCAMVFGSDAADINSAMLDTSRLQKIAEENQRKNLTFNYSGSLFTQQPPSNGLPAQQIDVFYSFLNQSQWKYDQNNGKYLKFEDFADGSGNFQPAKDRINGDQLAFSNVIVLYSEHIVLNPYIIDLNMGPGEKGKAIVFRDGQKFEEFWSTIGGEYEKTTGLRRPLRIVDSNGDPFPLKPGQTWVHIVTPVSQVLDQGSGMWKLRFFAPKGSK